MSFTAPFQAFSTTPGQLLVFRVLSMSGSTHVTIRDGSDINSPAILVADIDFRYNKFSNPLGTVITTKERITIEIRHDGNRYGTDVKFELLSVMPGKLVL